MRRRRVCCAGGAGDTIASGPSCLSGDPSRSAGRSDVKGILHYSIDWRCGIPTPDTLDRSKGRYVRVRFLLVTSISALFVGAGIVTPPVARAAAAAYTISPSGGPIGTKIAFSGTGCARDSAKAFDGVFGFDSPSTNGPSVHFVSNADGSFSGVYDTAADPPGTYSTFLLCHGAEVPSSGPTFTLTPRPGSNTYLPTSPFRLLDTRDGTGLAGMVAKVPAGGTIDVSVSGIGGAPQSGVAAVVLNVTATNAAGPESFITVFPSGTVRPLASNLNIQTSVAVPNLVTARLGDNGKVSFYNNLGSTDLVADVQGWYVTAGTAGGTGAFTQAPARILDTRTGVGAPLGKVGAGQQIDLTVNGAGGVPSSAKAVVLNVTATNFVGPETFITVFPSSASRPLSSNLNVSGSRSVPNLVVARVSDNGKVSLYNNLGSVDLVADVLGYYAVSDSGRYYFPLPPTRSLDTRIGTGVNTPAPLGPGGSLDLSVTGTAGVPSQHVSAVLLNTTATNASGPESFVTAFPTGAARPLASNLNFVAGQTIPNLVQATVGTAGKITLYNNVGTVDLVADVQGWFGY